MLRSWNVNGWQSACDKGLFEHRQKMTEEFRMSCSCRRRPTSKVLHSDEPEMIVKKLLTLGYQYVKLVASQQHRLLEYSLHRSIRLPFCQRRALSSWVE